MIKSQFNYCPLVRMCCSIQSNDLINKIDNGQSLRISYKIRKPVIRICLEHKISLRFIKEICKYWWQKFIKLLMLMASPHRLWTLSALSVSLSVSVSRCLCPSLLVRKFQVLSTDLNDGIETIICRTPILWRKLPSEYKLAAFLKEFKVKIKKRKCDSCPCRCKKKFNQILGLLIKNMV